MKRLLTCTEVVERKDSKDVESVSTSTKVEKQPSSLITFQIYNIMQLFASRFVSGDPIRTTKLRKTKITNRTSRHPYDRLKAFKRNGEGK